MAEPEPEAANSPVAPGKVEITEAVTEGFTNYYLQYTAPGQVLFVIRRYSEFDKLRAAVGAPAAEVEITRPFPPKQWLAAWQQDVVTERRSQLEQWLNGLLELNVVPSEVVLFLAQTDPDKAATVEQRKRMNDALVAQIGHEASEFVAYKTKHGTNGKHWATEKNACMSIERSGSGIASEQPKTVTELFTLAKDCSGSEPALWWEEPAEGPDGQTTYTVREWTWQQYYDDSMSAAKGFIALGVEQFGAVSIIGFNAPAWNMACLGAMAAGAKAAGVYATNEPEACRYIVDHSESSVVVVEDAKQMAKFTKSGILAKLPKVTALVQYLGVPAAEKEGKVRLLGWEAFLALGGDQRGGALKGAADEKVAATLAERMAQQKPGHCCSLIYTSGTTGPPKVAVDVKVIQTPLSIFH
jgi:hypothetical protein